MKKIILCCSLLVGVFTATSAQNIASPTDSLMMRRISDTIMENGQCYHNLKILTKQIGHRLSGSQQSKQAIEWGVKTLKEAGADSVWLQPAMVTHWERGTEWLKLNLGNGTFIKVPMLSLGNTEGTNGKTLTATILLVNNFEELAALPESQVKGKIIYYNHHFPQSEINTFNGYGNAVSYRGRKALSAAAKKGAIAVIIRSISTAEDDAPHAGVSGYEEGVNKIPAMAVGNITADKIEQAFNNQMIIKAQFNTQAHLFEPILSYNVIGELKGQDDSIMVVGGHLDSWDVGEGAQDDGAGCVQSIEVLRTFKKLGFQPKHTIRAVLFMNEENGSGGGKAYADSAKSKNEPHIFALESDAGGYSPRGFGLEMAANEKQVIKSWKSLFEPYGVYDFSQEESGVDISPLKSLNVPLSGLLPDSQRYFDMHHSQNDVFEGVSQRELKLGAVAMANLIYLIQKYW